MATLPEQHKPKSVFTKGRRRTKSPNEAFYKQKSWTNLSKQVREEQPICIWYGKRPNCTKYSKIADHKKALPDGGNPTDRNNLQGMCLSCSAAKTNMEQQKRQLGGKKTITPNGLV